VSRTHTYVVTYVLETHLCMHKQDLCPCDGHLLMEARPVRAVLLLHSGVRSDMVVYLAGSSPSPAPSTCACIFDGCATTHCCGGLTCYTQSWGYKQCLDTTASNSTCTSVNQWAGDGSVYNPYKPCCNPHTYIDTDNKCTFACQGVPAHSPSPGMMFCCLSKLESYVSTVLQAPPVSPLVVHQAQAQAPAPQVQPREARVHHQRITHVGVG
jgi:hypothetical protein